MIKLLPWLPHMWGWQMTQPLLFDDCLSILQKILLLARKLNEIISDYNSFKEDFDTWKKQVDDAITDLLNSLTDLDTRLEAMESCCQTVQSDIETIRNNITNIFNDLTTLNADFTNLNTRVTNLETSVTNIQNALARLDIQLPLELVDDTNFAAVGDAWYNWLADYCDTAAGHTSGTFASYLTRTMKIVPGVSSPTPAQSLTIGKLGQNLVLCKLPFMLIATLQQATTKANEAAVLTEVLGIVNDSGLAKLFTDGINSANPYFTITALEPYPYNIDNCKFQTSYMQFMYGSAAATDINNLYKIDFTSNGAEISHATCINMDVRIEIIKDSPTIRMQVISNELYFAVYNGEVVFYFIAENA